MGLGIYLDPTKIPQRVLAIKENVEGINTPKTPEFVVLDDTQGEVVQLFFNQIVELKAKGTPDIDICFDGIKFREMDRHEKDDRDTDIEAVIALEKSAVLKKINETVIGTIPNVGEFAPIYNQIQMASLEELKDFLVKIFTYILLRGNTP